MRRHSAGGSPVQFIVVREERVRADQGEVRAQAGALADTQRIVEGSTRLGSILQQEGEQAAIATAFSADEFIAYAAFFTRMPDLFHLGVRFQPGRQGERILAHPLRTGDKGSAVLLQRYCVATPQRVISMLPQEG